MVTARNTTLTYLFLLSVAILLLCGLTATAQTSIRPNILNITDKLQKDKQVHLGYPVGFAGEPETNNVNDTTWFWTASGCTGFIDKVNWFMLKRLKPIDGMIIISLTKEEFNLYCSRFKKEDELFTCD